MDCAWRRDSLECVKWERTSFLYMLNSFESFFLETLLVNVPILIAIVPMKKESPCTVLGAEVAYLGCQKIQVCCADGVNMLNGVIACWMFVICAGVLPHKGYTHLESERREKG